jgi:hypothetical protein
MLKVGGIWVSPIEVENCIREHPSVLEVAVVGKEDEQGLVKPMAYVVLREGYEPSPELEDEIKKMGSQPTCQTQIPTLGRVRKRVAKERKGKDPEIQASLGKQVDMSLQTFTFPSFSSFSVCTCRMFPSISSPFSSFCHLFPFEPPHEKICLSTLNCRLLSINKKAQSSSCF